MNRRILTQTITVTVDVPHGCHGIEHLIENAMRELVNRNDFRNGTQGRLVQHAYDFNDQRVTVDVGNTNVFRDSDGHQIAEP